MVEADTEQNEGRCGIIMPISSIDGCDESHWLEVRSILSDAIESAGFEANLVSDADDIGVIQKRIIQNIYENPIIVCDVSAKNPNVMFELGMRLAFDKPVIIVKDDKTSYSFDTSPIEHLEYPRDLRFPKMVEFKESLAKKLKATHKAASTDPDYTTFLKHFGTFTVAKLDEKEVSGNELVLSEIQDLRDVVLSLSRRVARSSYSNRSRSDAKHSRQYYLDRNIDLRDTEKVIRYKIKVDPDMVSQDIKDAFSGVLDSEKIYIRDEGSGEYSVVLPDMGEKYNDMFSKICRKLSVGH